MDRAPLRDLWGRLAEPIEYHHTVEALLGLSRSAVALLRSALLALSAETDDLLRAMPRLSRAMAVSTIDRSVRTIGQVRGPILWSETIAARASSFGDEAVFVCKATNRAYDTPENRVLAHALWLIVDAAKTVETTRAAGHWNEVAADVRAVGTDAVRFLDHRTLDGVPRRRPTGREIHRTRAGSKRRSYAPALDLLARAHIPFDLTDIEAVADDDSLRWHDLLVRTLDAVIASGDTLRGLRADSGILFTGPVSFRHPAHRNRDHPAAVKVGSVLLQPAGLSVTGDPAAVEVGPSTDLQGILAAR